MIILIEKKRVWERIERTFFSAKKKSRKMPFFIDVFVATKRLHLQAIPFFLLFCVFTFYTYFLVLIVFKPFSNVSLEKGSYLCF